MERIQIIFGWIALLIGCIGLILLIFFLIGHSPLSINATSWLPLPPAWGVNVLLIMIFGLQHSIMARPWFKEILTRHLPKSMERSFYIFCTGLVLGAIPFFWQPMPTVLWAIEHPIGLGLIYFTFVAGSLLAFLAVIAIDAFELIGFRQAGIVSDKELSFRKSWLHKRIRHPIYLGLIVIFWSTPSMTVGHLLFAISMTVYIRIGIHFEERQLIRTYGDTYRDYIKNVPMLIPFLHIKENTSPN